MIKINDLLWDDSLKIYQDDEKFKFSIDSVLLANFVTLNSNSKKILDIGTGNAPIAMMLTKRTKNSIVGVEIQKESFEMAKKSVEYNKLSNQIELINSDIIEYAKNIESDSFDTIVSNPPYFKSNNFQTLNECKRIARDESKLDLENLFKVSKKLLKNGGNIAIVNRTDRLIEIITLMKNNNIEPKRLQLIYPKQTKDSNLLLIEGIKNGKSSLKFLPPLIIHNEDNTFNSAIVNILTHFGE